MAGKHIRLTPHQQELYAEVLEYLIIDPDDLDSGISNHAAQYAYLAQVVSSAKGRAADLKIELDYLKAKALIQAKQATITDGMNKVSAVTDTLAKAYMDVDDTVMDSRKAHARAEEQVAFWQFIMDAMYQKSYMLSNLAQLHIGERSIASSVYNEEARHQVKSAIPGVAKETQNNLIKRSKADALSRMKAVMDRSTTTEEQ